MASGGDDHALATDNAGDPAPPAARRHLGAGAVASLFVQVAPLVGVTLVSVVVARHLGPDATGDIALLTSLLEVLVALFGFGLTTGITYYVSRGDWSARDAFREGQLAGLTLGAVGVGFGLAVFAVTRDELFAGISVLSALLAIGHLPATLARGFSGAIALARERYEAYAAFELAGTAVLIATAVPLTFAIGLDGALLGILAGRITAFAVSVVWGVRYGRVARVSPHARSRRLRQAAVFGSKAWGATLLQLVNYRLDLFLLGAFVARADVGRYSVALSITALVWVLPAALETVIFPRTADLHAAQGRGEIGLEESDRATARAVRHSIVLLIPATLAVLALVVLAIPVLYGPAFAKSIWLGLILMPGVVALSLGKTLSAVVTGRGHPQVALWITAITVPLTIVLYVTLIPPLGPYGAALGSTVSYLTSTGLALFWFRRTTDIPLRAALLPSRAELHDYVTAIAHLRRRLRPSAT